MTATVAMGWGAAAWELRAAPGPARLYLGLQGLREG